VPPRREDQVRVDDQLAATAEAGSVDGGDDGLLAPAAGDAGEAGGRGGEFLGLLLLLLRGGVFGVPFW